MTIARRVLLRAGDRILAALVRAVGAHPLGTANPVEAFMFAAVSIQGAAVLLGLRPPTLIEVTLPPLLRIAWAGCLFTGGLAALVGMSWRGSAFDALRIKRVGIVFASTATLTYGVALAGAGGWYAAILNLGFSLACLVMLAQIHLSLRAAHQQLAELRRRGR